MAMAASVSRSSQSVLLKTCGRVTAVPAVATGSSALPSCSRLPRAIASRAGPSAPHGLRFSTSSALRSQAQAVSSPPSTAAAPLKKWHPTSRRVGLIGRKTGMTTYFLPNGEAVPCTILHICENQISAVIDRPATPGIDVPFGDRPKNVTVNGKDYLALQVAAFNSTRAHVNKPILGHLARAGITGGKKVMKEFAVTRDALVPLGTTLNAAHFVPGQQVDVQAVTKGKGFQGAMKRHGFKGLRASHGTSVSHRSHGSTGQNTSPARVFPGKRMAGRMGGNRTSTQQNLMVVRVDTRASLLFVSGAVPGPDKGYVYIKDALKEIVDRSARSFATGKTRTGELTDGTEGSEVYLPAGVDDLPFPAGTEELAKTMPRIIDIGLVK